MRKRLVPISESAANSSRIYHLLYDRKSISRSDIAYELRLSLPTVNQHLSALLDSGIIQKGELRESTGGRKAQTYEFVSTYRYALGLDIWQESTEIVLLDLDGSISHKSTFPVPFENNAGFQKALAEAITKFVQETGVPFDHILGMGVAVQGIVVAGGERVLYGDAMNTAGLSSGDFEANLPWPCTLIHNVDAAAMAESWHRDSLNNAFYLFLSEHFGAALIIDGVPYRGDNSIGSTIEHMCLIPNGQPCYCGKRGCVETYCSERSLLTHAQESAERFFSKLRLGEKKEETIWSDYLRNLALVIDNIRMVLPCPVILGGTLADYIEQPDIARLEDTIAELSSFKSQTHILSKAICGKTSAAQGAALHFIIRYLNAM